VTSFIVLKPVPARISNAHAKIFLAQPFAKCIHLMKSGEYDLQAEDEVVIVSLTTKTERLCDWR
jgi:hypothetical protein